jgi:hypothetical protein
MVDNIRPLVRRRFACLNPRVPNAIAIAPTTRQISHPTDGPNVKMPNRTDRAFAAVEL